MKRFILNSHRFGQSVRAWIDGRPLRELSEAMGTSIATLSRVSMGHKPDVDTFLDLCQRMEADPASFGFWVEED